MRSRRIIFLEDFMKRISILFLFVFFAVAGFAQGRGGHGGGTGGGPPSGMGNGSASGMGTGMGRGNTSGTGSASSNHSTSSTSGPRSPGALLTQNTKLSSNLQKLLPKGTTPQQACSGYKNLGQCVAAIHVAHNLGISFTDLKNKTTGSGSESLGKAIHALKPDANAKSESKKAQKQAKEDVEESS